MMVVMDRRTVLKAGLVAAGAAAVGLPEAQAAERALPCFFSEKLPHGCLAIYAKLPNRPAMALLDVEPYWEIEDRQPALIIGDHFVATVFKPWNVVAPPVKATSNELEVAAKAMLEVTARRNGQTEDPEAWFEDHDLPFDRVIRVGRWDIAGGRLGRRLGP